MIIIETPRVNKCRPRLDQDSTRPHTKNNAENEANKGQGEGVTRWKGCLVMQGLLRYK